MSCANPRIIKNPSKHWSQGMPFHFGVPCGQCPDCRQAKRNDWYIRAVYEFEHMNKLGCYGIFETLTYAPENVPTHFGIKHFDGSHIRLFFQRLKSFIEDVNPKFTFSDKNNYISYLITCEYGASPDRSHNPHYHALFFPHVQGLDYRDFLACVAKAWKWGFSNPINRFVKGKDGKSTYYHDYDWVIKDSKRLSYVCKYVSKEPEFNADLFSVIDGLHTAKSHAEVIRKIKRKISPFIRASHGFGISGVDHYNGNITSSSLSYSCDKSHIVKRVLTRDGEMSLKFRIPLYLQTKLFKSLVYEVREDGKKHPVYYYNYLGKTRKSNLDEQIRSAVRVIETRFANYYSLARQIIQVEQESRYAHRASWALDDLDELANLIKDKVEDFALYYTLYHDTYVKDIDNILEPHDLLRVRFNTNPYNYIKPSNVSNTHHLLYRQAVVDGRVPRFAPNFVHAAELYDNIQEILNPLLYERNQETDRVKRHLRDMCVWSNAS